MSKKSVISPNCFCPFIFQPRNKPSQLTLLKFPCGAARLPGRAHSTPGHGAVLEAAARHSCRPPPPQGPATP